MDPKWKRIFGKKPYIFKSAKIQIIFLIVENFDFQIQFWGENSNSLVKLHLKRNENQ